jgi:hypothetical protein
VAQGNLRAGHRAVPSQWGLATFVRAGLPVIGQSQGFVHGAFSADGFGTHPRSRSAHAVRVQDAGAHRTLTVAHMHGLRDLGGTMDTPARLEQARRPAALVRQIAADEVPLVVTTVPLHQARALRRLHARQRGRPGDPVDVVTDPEVSDHCPLLLEL